VTALRFDFQRTCATDALTADARGLVINCGCNDDPANLKALDPDRVLNCDLFEHDQVLDRANTVDVTFDCARERWPFDDGAAALVILGDILEHLSPAEIKTTLAEARRVGLRLCVTVPEDHRSEVSDERADAFPRGAVHRTTVTEPLLRELLTETGFEPTGWEHVVYDDGTFWGERTMGHFVQAE
jgi:hypothetical protein